MSLGACEARTATGSNILKLSLNHGLLSPIKYSAGAKYRNAGHPYEPYQEPRFRTLLLEFEQRPAKWFDKCPQDACTGDDSDMTSITLSIDHIR